MSSETEVTNIHAHKYDQKWLFSAMMKPCHTENTPETMNGDLICVSSVICWHSLSAGTCRCLFVS